MLLHEKSVVRLTKRLRTLLFLRFRHRENLNTC
nr:MAG TPA: hypothetical protein [Caudoviricetes sp.]